MYKKISSGLIVVLSVLFLLTACSTTKVEDQPNEQEKKIVIPPTEGLDSCETSVDAAKLMIKSVIEGLTQDNYELYSRDFTEQNKKYFNEQVFTEAIAAVKDELGDFESDTYVGFWVKGKYTIVLWKARFTDTDDDILIEMYVSKNNNEGYKIAAVKVI